MNPYEHDSNEHDASFILDGPDDQEVCEITRASYKRIDVQTMVLTSVSLDHVLSATQMSMNYYLKLRHISSYITRCKHGLLLFVPCIRLIVSNSAIYILDDGISMPLSGTIFDWPESLCDTLKSIQDLQERQPDAGFDRTLINLFRLNGISASSSPEAMVLGAIAELLCRWNAEEYSTTKSKFSKAREERNLIAMQLALQQHAQHITQLDNILYSINYFTSGKFFSSSEEGTGNVLLLREVLSLLKSLNRDLYALKYQITEQVEYSALYLSNYRDSLDRKRNKLIKIQLYITYISLGIGFISLISGLFGMNLMNFANYPNEPPAPFLQWSKMGSLQPLVFYIICIASLFIFVAVVFMLILYTRCRLDYDQNEK